MAVGDDVVWLPRLQLRQMLIVVPEGINEQVQCWCQVSHAKPKFAESSGNFFSLNEGLLKYRE